MDHKRNIAITLVLLVYTCKETDEMVISYCASSTEITFSNANLFLKFLTDQGDAFVTCSLSCNNCTFLILQD